MKRLTIPGRRRLAKGVQALTLAAGVALGGLAPTTLLADGHGDAPEYLGTNPDWPFSDAVRLGDTLYLSGKLGTIPGTATLVEGGIQPETRQTLENIKASLERHGSSMDRVVKCTVFLADIDEWAAMNEVYKTYFPENRPARSALGASGLALDGRVEIECIAMVGE
jgi:reactive intermediate/imine deaminase